MDDDDNEEEDSYSSDVSNEYEGTVDSLTTDSSCLSEHENEFHVSHRHLILIPIRFKQPSISLPLAWR